MYKLEFTLKQHTPLIHFQHEQEGVSLRASELKPKIDNFILNYLQFVDSELYHRYKPSIDKFFGNDSEKVKTTAYKLNTSANLVNKVLCFSYPNNNDLELIQNNPNARRIADSNFDISVETPLFANNSFIKFGGSHRQGNRYIRNDSEWDMIKIGVWLSDIRLTVFSFQQDVFNLVCKCLPYVFAMENFGLRQSKGFGSFSIEVQNKEHTKSLLSIPGICAYEKQIPGDWKEYLKEVVNTWKLLKAGNTHTPYYKADIMKYFCKLNGNRWEKRIVKKKIHDNFLAVWNEIKNNGNNPRNHKIAGCGRNSDLPDSITSTEKYSYVRALLGLAEFYEFGMNNRGRDRTIIEIKEQSKEIERFRSPITFKIIEDTVNNNNNNTIYMICHPIPTELSKRGLSDRLYEFSIDSTVTAIPYNGLLERLIVPSNFSLCNFLDSAWLGSNFQNSVNWGQPTVSTVAGHHGYTKIEP